MLQIVFSDSYKKCFDIFIEKLEGAVRTMEVVPSELLKHSVELTLRKVFRIIRSVKSASLRLSPESWSRFFTDYFGKTSDDLSDHATMSKQNLFYRVKLSRNQEIFSGLRAVTQVKLNCFNFYILKNYKKEKITNLLIQLFSDTDETNILEILNLNMIYQGRKRFMTKPIRKYFYLMT
jgi:hypothetical protein